MKRTVIRRIENEKRHFVDILSVDELFHIGKEAVLQHYVSQEGLEPTTTTTMNAPSPLVLFLLRFKGRRNAGQVS